MPRIPHLMSLPAFSHHARMRCQQRAARGPVFDLVYRHADRRRVQRDGRAELSLSLEAGQALVADGHDPALVARARTTALIVDRSEAVIITVLRRSPEHQRMRTGHGRRHRGAGRRPHGSKVVR